jgi:diadenosine tetraphosphate (Ap4A) HIT family hydrolase
MSGTEFQLDPRLQADTQPVAALPLCDVLLMKDARFAWLILVPRRPGCSELLDLPEDLRPQLWREIDQAAAALRDAAPCDKLNVGALGNIVRQLHVHVVARQVGDAAWPGPVWGSGAAQAYGDNELSSLLQALRRRLAPFA